MKKWLIPCLLLLLCACSSKEEQLTDEEAALKAAVTYYEALYDGDYKTFLDGRMNADEMPESFREDLIDAYKQHVAKVKDQRRGIKKIEASRAKMDSTLGVMQVYLIMHYGDSEAEEIVVPMVEHDGDWMLK